MGNISRRVRRGRDHTKTFPTINLDTVLNMDDSELPYPHIFKCPHCRKNMKKELRLNNLPFLVRDDTIWTTLEGRKFITENSVSDGVGMPTR